MDLADYIDENGIYFGPCPDQSQPIEILLDANTPVSVEQDFVVMMASALAGAFTRADLQDVVEDICRPEATDGTATYIMRPVLTRRSRHADL